MKALKLTGGYVSLMASGAGFLITRFVLLPYPFGGPETVSALPIGLVCGLLSVATGALGVWLLLPAEHRMVIALSIAYLLAAAPTLIGTIGSITSRAAGGDNNIGAPLMIYYGSSALVVGFGLVFATLVGVAVYRAKKNSESCHV